MASEYQRVLVTGGAGHAQHLRSVNDVLALTPSSKAHE